MSGGHDEYVTQAREPSPYRILRKKNVKTYKFQLKETYPTIKPRKNICLKEDKTNLDKGLKDCGCDMRNYHCLKCDTNPYTVPRKKFVKLDPLTDYCKNRKPIEGTPAWRKKANMKLDWNKMKPYDVLRMENCKEWDFTDCEMYHSVRPPQYKCSMEKTANVLYGAVEDSALERVFDMEEDDVVKIYKVIPKGKGLRFYGISSYKQSPDAIKFNRLISACLNKVSPPKPKIKPVRPKPPPKQEKEPCSMILNLPELAKMVAEMPTVVSRVDYKSTFCWKFRSKRCSKHKPPFKKDLKKPKPVPLDAALDMVKPAKKEKHGLRRKHKYCELVCGIPENACTELEYRKYLQNPEEYEAAFLEEMKREAQFVKPEPENYEELFKELITCFERQPCDQEYKNMKDCFDNLNNQGGGGNDDDSYVSEDKEPEADDDAPEPEKPKPKKEPKYRPRRKTKEPAPPPPPPPPPEPLPPPPPEVLPTPPCSSSTSSLPHPPPKPTKPDVKKSKQEGKDCPCDLCQWMKKGETEPDTPEMARWKKEIERRKLMDYIKMKCHQEYMSKRPQEYRAPLRKCDDIVCDDCFCCTSGFGDCCDALGIIQQLENVLPSKHISLLQRIRDRISSSLCGYV